MPVVAVWMAIALGAAPAPAAGATPRGAAGSERSVSQSQPVPWMRTTEADRARAIEELVAKPLRDRLLAVSERFLGTPYMTSPLGEGTGFDADPLIRFDGVDCLTFVEQVMAMSTVARSSEVLPVLNQIRYFGDPGYAERNHLMEAQWLPNALRRGFLVEATHKYGGADVQELTKQISPVTWTSRSASLLALPRDSQPVGVFSLPVIPIAKVGERLRKVPSGVVVVVVREERPLLVTRVSHVGFVVQKHRTYMRHASRSFGKVVDEDLESFLQRNAHYGRWKVVGVALYEIQPFASPSTPRTATAR